MGPLLEGPASVRDAPEAWEIVDVRRDEGVGKRADGPVDEAAGVADGLRAAGPLAVRATDGRGAGRGRTVADELLAADVLPPRGGVLGPAVEGREVSRVGVAEGAATGLPGVEARDAAALGRV